MFIEAASVNGAAKSILNFWDTINRRDHPGVQYRPGLSVTMVTFRRDRRNQVVRSEFLEAVRARNIAVHVIEEKRRFDRTLIPSVRRLLQETSPDIVQTNNVKSHFLVKSAGVKDFCPWIAFHHGYTRTDFKMRCYNELDRWALPSADRVVTVCDAFRNRLAEIGVKRSRIHVVHNASAPVCPISTITGEAVRKRLGIDPSCKIVLAIGRLSREKGHANLIESLGHLGRAYPGLNYKLVLVGFGPELKRLEAHAVKHGVRSRVIFACNEPDVAPFFEISDLFVLPSLTEGSPHVIFEAMSAGVPIIATRVGGIPEILQDGHTGILSEAGDTKTFAHSIARLLQCPEEAKTLAFNATCDLGRRFSPDNYAQSLLSIYSEFSRG